MYLKTTSPQFLKYGAVKDTHDYPTRRVIIEGKNPDHLDVYDVPVQIQVLEGIAVLEIRDEMNERDRFVIHRAPVLNKEIPFTIIPLTQSAVISISYQGHEPVNHVQIKVPNQLTYEPIRPTFSVTDIYSYYYNVKGANYRFDGESHFFWELTYVDTGELHTEIDGHAFTLSSQQLAIYFPGQFHTQHVDSGKSSSYLTIMFDMNIRSKDVQHLKNRVFDCNSDLYQLTDKFIRHSTIMEQHDVPYSRDLMISYLQELVILLIQYDQIPSEKQSLENPIQANFENELMAEINNFIQKNIFEPITVDDICNQFSISRSTLHGLFKKNLDIPPKLYINEIKMAKAQHLILEESMTITEIADKLGFSSIHYFSRKFKKRFGLSPSEFSQSIYKDPQSD